MHLGFKDKKNLDSDDVRNFSQALSSWFFSGHISLQKQPLLFPTHKVGHEESQLLGLHLLL